MSADVQEAQKFVDQLDYDYSAAAADVSALQRQRPVADLMWYDYGGGGGGGSGGGGGGSYYGPATMLIGGEKRGGATQSSTGGMWFGPRLGRRKRHGGGGGGGIVQPLDGNTVRPAMPQDAIAEVADAAAAAAEQATITDLIDNAPWLLESIIENSSESDAFVYP